MIHGWAANGRVFDPLRESLPENWRIRTPDLPGHGASPDNGAFDITATADALAAEIDDGEPADLLGWSLGGLVALHLAHRHPQKVRKLCLTASFAKFLAAPDYPEGLSNPALGKMITLFRQDYQKYMRQFLELQFLYAKEARPLMHAILPDIVKHGTPAALETALAALSAADARPFLPTSGSRCCWFTATKTPLPRRAWATIWRGSCPMPPCTSFPKRRTHRF